MAFVNKSFILLLCCFFTTHIRSPSPSFNLIATNTTNLKTPKGDSCIINLQKLRNNQSKCLYNQYCTSQGYVNYHYIFSCICGSYPFLGYTLLTLWLLVLFYLLANTASQYFCPSVERLSRELRLSPTTSGVALLSLGNGSPDVFASIVSFRSGLGEVGLSSVLGGAFFVSCVVVGIINVCARNTSRSSACIDRDSFIHVACFFLLALCSLVVILVVGKINILGAVAFMSLYLVYVLIVSIVHFRRVNDEYDEYEEDDDEPLSTSKEAPQGNKKEYPSGYYIEKFKAKTSFYIRWFVYLIHMPLYLPRRLTIPDVSEERWSKPFAVSSATFSPLLVAALWNSKRGTRMGTSIKEEALTIYTHAIFIGILLGAIALQTTNKAWPPKKGLQFPWLAMGFLMSVLWTYVIAEELVGLLVSLGFVFGINPSILGLTVLAWGNSIGDLIANVAMAMSGGQGGAQIAISGCYAGPIFNTLVGLGSSFVVSAWSAHPKPFVIPVRPQLFEILGFMIGGLVWALVILPKREMKLDRVLGLGLLAIYSCFLSWRLSQSLGLMKL